MSELYSYDGENRGLSISTNEQDEVEVVSYRLDSEMVVYLPEYEIDKVIEALQEAKRRIRATALKE